MSDKITNTHLEPERRLNGVRVERVHYALNALALEVAGLGIELYVVRIRNLSLIHI